MTRSANSDSDHTTACAHRTSRLPTELWDLVLKSLPSADQRFCLSVSRLFCDLARPLLFSRLTIHFGLWTAHNNRNYPASEARLIERHDLRNTELFQHITHDAHFASIIKEIDVRAHDRRKWSDIGRLLIVTDDG